MKYYEKLHCVRMRRKVSTVTEISFADSMTSMYEMNHIKQALPVLASSCSRCKCVQHNVIVSGKADLRVVLDLFAFRGASNLSMSKYFQNLVKILTKIVRRRPRN